MRTAATAIFLGLLGLCPASGETVGPSPEMAERIGELSQWIVENSDYEAVPEKEPAYIYLSGAELRYMATGQVATSQVSGKGFDYLAIYLDRIMFLRDDFVPGRDDQILLHELVHHFQWASGREFSCLGKREKEAYELQIEYAESISEEPRIPNPLALAVLTSC